jgi:hypothetical protein
MFLMAGCTPNNSTTKSQQWFKTEAEEGRALINLDNVMFITFENEGKCTIYLKDLVLLPMEIANLQTCNELFDILIGR